MIKKIAVIFTALIIFSPLLWASDVQYQESQAPALVLAKPSNVSGSLLVNVFRTDSIEDEFIGKVRLFIIPTDKWQSEKDLKYINDYLVNISNNQLIKGIKPGAYIIGISTQYHPSMALSMSATGPTMKMVMPNDFYSWDGWSQSPGLENVNGKMYYITWYSREIVPERKSIIVAMRIKKGTDINGFLSGLSPAKPLYTVSVTTSDSKLNDILQIVRKYGKAFLNENHVFFVRDTKSGNLSEYKIVEGKSEIATPTNINISDAPSSQNQLIIKNGTTSNAVVRIKKKGSDLVVWEQHIPAGKSGSVNLPAGEYYDVVRFQSKSGAFSYSKGDGFTLKPNKFSKLVMTLHPVLNGNYHSYNCSAKDFD